MFPSHVTLTFYRLSAERAAAISAVCKVHGATVQRLAQGRSALGLCKVVATFASAPGWADNNTSAGQAKAACVAAGLTNALTFQRP